MSQAWYLINSKARKENLLWQQLKLRNLETFYPRLQVSPVNPRSRTVRPYFPGYLFVHLDLAEYGFSKLAWVPGLKRIVVFDKEPAKVPDEIIERLRNRLAQQDQLHKVVEDELQPGQPVRVVDSCFEGYEAVFDTRLDGKGRVRVLLKFINDQQVRLELSEEQVRRK